MEQLPVTMGMCYSYVEKIYGYWVCHVQFSATRRRVLISHGSTKECRSIVRDESSVYFNVTAVNRYDI